MALQSKVKLAIEDRKSGGLIIVQFDVVTTDSWESLLQITEHPIEAGSDVADHAAPQSKRVTIEGYVSNKPLYTNPGVSDKMRYQRVELAIPEKSGGASIFTPGGLNQAATGAISKGVNKLLGRSQAKSANVLKASGDMPQRDREIYRTLIEAQENRSLVKVYAHIGELESMMIERVNVPRTPADGNGSSFQVDLKQVTIASSETVEAPIPDEVRALANVDLGSKGPIKDESPKKEDELKNLESTFHAGGSALGVF